MKKSVIISTFTILLFSITVHSQDILVEYNPVSKLKLYYDEYYIQFEFAIEEKLEIELQDDLYYYWYKEKKVNRTQGGFDGKALHGDFTVFFLSGKLKEKGQFNLGLKQDKWKKWYEEGTLFEVGNWDNGLKTGMWVQYDKQGRLEQKANYVSGVLDGELIKYAEGEPYLVKKYNNGKEIKRKEKKEKPSREERKEERKKRKEEKKKDKEKNEEPETEKSTKETGQ